MQTEYETRLRIEPQFWDLPQLHGVHVPSKSICSLAQPASGLAWHVMPERRKSGARPALIAYEGSEGLVAGTHTWFGQAAIRPR